MKVKVEPDLATPSRRYQHQPALEFARLAILSMDTFETEDVLSHLPKHTLEPLFIAYSDWLSNTSPADFKVLLDMVPSLDQQVFYHGVVAFPGICWEAWCTEIVSAVRGNKGVVLHQIADLVVQSLLCPTKRALAF